MSTLLGAPERLVKENETTTWETSKIGGMPDWFQADILHPCCSRCKTELILVTQIYCPLSDSSFHRCLYVFVCPEKACSNQCHGWRVVRGQLLDKQSAKGSENGSSQDNWGQDDWGQGQDDWGQGQDDWGEGQDDWGQDDETKTDSTLQPESSIATTADRLSEMVVTDKTTSTDSTVIQSESERNPNQESNPPLPLQHSGKKTFANVVSQSNSGDNNDKNSNSDTEPAAASASKDEMFEATEGVEVEAVTIDGEGVQRMMELLALRQATETDSKDEAACGKKPRDFKRATFPAYYLEVFAESEVESDMTAHVNDLLQDYKQREGKDFAALLDDHRKGGAGAQTEQYDKTEVKHGDKLCYKFIKRVQLYPPQCVRYQWNGSPLLMSKPRGTSTVDRCQHCGSSQVFELQLVPPLIPLLKLPGETESLVEFGTVLVYTCSKSCWSDSEGWREESVILQHDPYHNILK
ncbi:programmed cell death protein 2-like [Littorina saxatilis]|uniref:Programmed cell death protein 2 C-terminal domain-containing protein n=1 Tax=Littorina saxatilis TaxID=31220 RepID=A0AAN9AQZ4_9CAEN